MGYSFNETVQARHIFTVFRYRELRDGWGAAWYPDKSVQLFKEPVRIMSSELATFLTTYEEFKTPVLMAHVRIATVGSVLYKNTHPFQREFLGKQYVFSHNGTLTNYQNNLKLGSMKPIGTTDSEHLFCYILGQIEKENIQQWDSTNFEWLEDVFQTANGYGWMYCLFTDGDYLFAYRCSKTAEERLHYVERKTPYGTVYFNGLNQNVDLSKIYPSSAYGVIFASKPLSNEQWIAMKFGSLIVVKDGDIVFQ
jgi:glutamine amidotransferase